MWWFETGGPRNRCDRSRLVSLSKKKENNDGGEQRTTSAMFTFPSTRQWLLNQWLGNICMIHNVEARLCQEGRCSILSKGVDCSYFVLLNGFAFNGTHSCEGWSRIEKAQTYGCTATNPLQNARILRVYVNPRCLSTVPSFQQGIVSNQKWLLCRFHGNIRSEFHVKHAHEFILRLDEHRRVFNGE